MTKAIGINFIRDAIRRMLRVCKPIEGRVLDLDYKGAAVQLSRGSSAPTQFWVLRWPAPGPQRADVLFLAEARALSQELGLPLYATPGTAEALQAKAIKCVHLAKVPGEGRSGMDVIDDGLVDLVTNVPRTYDEVGRPDGYLIRRRAVDAEVSLVTDLMLARSLVNALRNRAAKPPTICCWSEYLERQPRLLE